jgi:hypothetical protein
LPLYCAPARQRLLPPPPPPARVLRAPTRRGRGLAPPLRQCPRMRHWMRLCRLEEWLHPLFLPTRTQRLEVRWVCLACLGWPHENRTQARCLRFLASNAGAQGRVRRLRLKTPPRVRLAIASSRARAAWFAWATDPPANAIPPCAATPPATATQRVKADVSGSVDRMLA